MTGLNLIWQWRGSNYRKVQTQIFGEITKHLPEGAVTSTREEADPERLNFTLFIGQPGNVLMSHGAADKLYMFRRSKTGRMVVNKFDHVLVPGDWLKRRLLATPGIELGPDQIHSVGWPRLDALLRTQAKTEFRPEPGARPRVLWAPSHDIVRRKGSVNLSSYPALDEHLDYFREHFDLDISLHPSNRTSKKPTENKLVACDYVISDMGTMVYDAWALGKPVIFPTWLIGEKLVRQRPGSAEAHIFEQEIGLHARSPEHLVELVMSRPTIDAKVTEFLNDYLDPTWTGTSGKRVADLLKKFAAERSAA